ncbi:FAD-dependent oxidoreductase [Anaerolactibacter massiliensis]|uniref:FAD-dependent oxidoreductase n=1 Tax=Anaerolactibacter massiliensis TaxID=2044573 RepID=UPI000CFA7A02|nr:FAD-dependent oxidoreductase [Anaerolactibacter massiliensis]
MKRNVLRMTAVCLAGMMALTGCSSGTAAPASAAASAETSGMKDGTYTETVQGRNADITVETTIEGGKITNVVVTDQQETKEVAGAALTDVPAAIVAANSVNVDGVTGATVTSDAIKLAVSNAITEAGGDPDSMAAAESTSSASAETVNLEADVVVVGAGGTGVSAALAAQQSGAKVILLEKAATVGGVSIIAGGPMGIDSQDQKDAGVAGTFTVNDVLDYWQSYNAWMDDGQLFYNIASKSGETIDWLQENGMEFTFMGTEQAAHADGFQTYHIYADQDNKLGYYETLVQKFEDAGGELYLETPATELHAENDKITGVTAVGKDGTTYEIKCDAVVLGTGGFGANSEMVEEKVGFPLETFTTGTQTGDGATMSQAIGAGVGKTIQQYHGVTSYSGIQTGQGKDEIAKAIYLASSVWVNRRGSRFCPEDLNYDTALCSNAAATQGEYFFSIMSEDMVDAVAAGGSQALGVDTAVAYEPTIPMFSVDEPWTDFKAALEDGVDKGIVFKGSNVEELAQNMGVDPDTLKQTLAQYDEYCAEGVDEVYGKDSKYLTALGDGTLYAVKARPVSLGGIGGVLVNSNLQVIKEDGTVIGGLYAAGNDVAEIYNNSYPLVEGVTMMTALTGGRICGLSAAEYAAN